ncbi:MAG: hypothetical protein IJQ00_10265, partial [Kiritimatiellae bacterium]|nr:hypothetical protein [Kiritimatiellia bacterium]
GERTRIRANRTAQPQSHTPERRRVVKSQAELVRLLSRWCVYFRALRFSSPMFRLRFVLAEEPHL